MSLSQEQRLHQKQRAEGGGGEAPKSAREVVALLKDRLREKEEYAQSIELEAHMLKETIKATQEEKDKISERIAADAKRIKELEEEAKQWKLEAFQQIGSASIMTSSEILATPECRGLVKEKEEREASLVRERAAKKRAVRELEEVKERLRATEPLVESTQAELEERKREVREAREEWESARAEVVESTHEKEEFQRALKACREELEKAREAEELLKSVRAENERLGIALAAEKQKNAQREKRRSAEALGGFSDSAPLISTTWHSEKESDRPPSPSDECVPSASAAVTAESEGFRPRSISTMTEQKSEREILLQRDRSNLIERIAALQEELEMTQTEKGLLMQDKTRLMEIVAKLDEELTELKNEHDANRATNKFEQIDESIHGQFNLPLTESNCGSFVCANEKLLLGSLYITQHYVCFAPNVLARSKFNIFKSQEEKSATITIELASITELRLKKLQRWSRNGRAIQIVTTDPTKGTTLRGFRSRDDAVQAILRQAAALNHRIALYDDTK
mmetsp:Transcript_7483/g.31689  ORF Transcript_7483/g.31689 Transcript_7483/m.31689 type:complete len:511 (+) Transcript_7483:39-1571(+)